MNIKTKLILQSPLWLWRMSRINKRARKYRRQPDYNSLQKRHDFLLKYIKKLFKTFKITVETQGIENLYKAPCLLTPNHTSNIDVMAMMYALRKTSFEEGVQNKVATFIAKTELTKRRVVRNAMSLLDTFIIDRKKFREAIEVSKNFCAYVKENKTYGIVFPEGTRTKDGNMGEFKTGVFHLAQSEFLPIVPVSIINGFDADNIKRSKKQKIIVKFHPVIKPLSFVSQDRKALAKKVEKIVENGIREYK